MPSLTGTDLSPSVLPDSCRISGYLFALSPPHSRPKIGTGSKGCIAFWRRHTPQKKDRSVQGPPRSARISPLLSSSGPLIRKARPVLFQDFMSQDEPRQPPAVRRLDVVGHRLAGG